MADVTPDPVIPADSSLLAWSDRALSRVENAAAGLAGTLIFAAMLLTIAEVIGRRLFNAPIPGVVDMFDIGMAGMALLGAAYCQRLGGHVRMELLTGALKGRPLWVVEFLTCALACGFIGVVALAANGHALRAVVVGDATMDILLPEWPSKALAAAALWVLFARLAINTVGYARLIVDPGATPLAIPAVESVVDHAQAEIADALSHDHPSPSARP
ncbi:MAG: TRAP transporter small permease [Rhodospirillaceae bacterium]|nr:TRAP transporter small permease [Rhodospirillaceae bacterium]